MNRRTWIIIAVIGVLGICALCIGAAAVGWISFNTVRITQRSGGPLDANVQATEAEQREFAVAAPALLEVRNFFGDVQITADAGESDTIRVTMLKTGFGVNLEAAEAALQTIEVDIEASDNRVTLRVDDSGGVQNNVRKSVAFTIHVPAETSVTVDSNTGDIRLSGTSGKADLHTQFGEIVVSDFEGGLAARTNAGRIEARRVALLASGDGDINLRTEFGELQLEDAVSGDVSLTSRSGQIQVNSLQSGQEVIFESEFGEIAWTGGSALGLQINARSGAVRLSDLLIDRPVSVETTFGEIRLSDVDAPGYDLRSGSGTISVDGVRGAVKAHSDQNNIRITGGDEASLDLFSRSGEVSYRGSLGEGPHTIETTFGQVVLSLPRESSFDIDFRTQFGDLSSDFEIDYEVQEDKRWEGTVNGGGPLVSVGTQNGPIRLESTP